MIKNIKIFTILFIVGYMIYPNLEQLFGAALQHFIGPAINHIFNTSVVFKSGKSYDANISMGIMGGIVLILLGMINEIKQLRKLPFVVHCLIATLIITILEEVSGQILNKGLFFGLHMDIWGYSWLPLSSPSGQTNVFFSLIWLAISPLCFFIDDTTRAIIDKVSIKEKVKSFLSGRRLCKLIKLRSTAEIPDWANWAAKDKDTAVFFYSAMPTVISLNWYSFDSCGEEAFPGDWEITGPWKNSLIDLKEWK